jgi:hypothetical protein
MLAAPWRCRKKATTAFAFIPLQATHKTSLAIILTPAPTTENHGNILRCQTLYPIHAIMYL